MSLCGFAFFVRQPRVIKDLFCPHSINQEHAFEVAKTITLSEISFENFCADMVADRLFLEENADKCSKGSIIRCILVKSKKSKDWILVVPDGAYVDLASVIPAR